jgi:hypothetical protein
VQARWAHLERLTNVIFFSFSCLYTDLREREVGEERRVEAIVELLDLLQD